jgi:hypothetical protein
MAKPPPGRNRRLPGVFGRDPRGHVQDFASRLRRRTGSLAAPIARVSTMHRSLAFQTRPPQLNLRQRCPRPASVQLSGPACRCRCARLPAMRSRGRRKPLPSSGDERLSSDPPVPTPIDGTEVTRFLLDRAGERPGLAAPARAVCRVGGVGARAVRRGIPDSGRAGKTIGGSCAGLAQRQPRPNDRDFSHRDRQTWHTTAMSAAP